MKFKTLPKTAYSKERTVEVLEKKNPAKTFGSKLNLKKNRIIVLTLQC